MTVYTLYALVCDAPHCGREVIASNEGESPEELAFSCGWGHHASRWLCDHHYPDALAGRPFGAPVEDVF